MPTERSWPPMQLVRCVAGGPRPCSPYWLAWCFWAALVIYLRQRAAPWRKRSIRSTTSTGSSPRSRDVLRLLQKPPLPRWSIAALMVLTVAVMSGSSGSPWVSGAATVALIYFLENGSAGGCWICSALVLVPCTRRGPDAPGQQRRAARSVHHAGTVRGWCRLHVDDDDPADEPARRSRAWVLNLVLYAVPGWGILTKGPVILLLVGVTVIPYLAISGKLVGLAGWPTFRSAVVRHDGIDLADRRPAARSERPWCLVEDVGEDGSLCIFPHIRHTLLLEQWPGIVLPWSLIAVVAVLLPFLPRDLDQLRGPSGRNRSIVWSRVLVVAPLVSLVVGRGQPGDVLSLDGCQTELLRPLPARYGLADRFDMVVAGRGGRTSCAGGGVPDLQAQWVAIFVAAMVAPLVLRPWIPVAVWPWSLAIALALAISVVVSVHAWRQGADASTGAALGRMCCRHRGRLRNHCPNRKLATQPPRRLKTSRA